MPVAVLVALMAVGCATSESPQPARTPATAPSARSQSMLYGGGDGSSCEKAVVIHARGEMAGVRAEYDWLAAKYPGYQRDMQSLTTCNEKPADKLHVRLPDGRELDVFFDISEYFGQF